MGTTKKTMTLEAWLAKGAELFGHDRMHWRFVCPSCGHVQTPKDHLDAGGNPENAHFSCVGRWLRMRKEAFVKEGDGPCNYAGGGLFQINPILVATPGGTDAAGVFDFATTEPAKAH